MAGHILQFRDGAIRSTFGVLVMLVCSCSFITDDSIPGCANEHDCKNSGLVNASGSGGNGGTEAVTPRPPRGGEAGTGASSPEAAGAAGQSSAGSGGANGGSGANGGAGASAGSDSGGTGGVNCVAKTETCNGVDDDCDALTDEGCAIGVTWDAAEDRPALGDSPFGEHFATECAKDQLLVGLRLSFNEWLVSVAGLCSRPTVKFVANGDAQIAFSSVQSSPQKPEAQDKFEDLSCGAGEILVGLRISQQNSALGAPENRVVIPAVFAVCAELYLSKPTELAWRTPRQIGPLQGSIANQTAWFHSDTLPATGVSVRVAGKAESWIDRLGFGVTKLKTKLK